MQGSKLMWGSKLAVISAVHGWYGPLSGGIGTTNPPSHAWLPPSLLLQREYYSLEDFYAAADEVELPFDTNTEAAVDTWTKTM